MSRYSVASPSRSPSRRTPKWKVRRAARSLHRASHAHTGNVGCFLGYLCRFRAVALEQLSLAHFLDAALLEAFIQHLKTERNVATSSLVNYVTSFIRVLKYLHRSDARVLASSDFAAVPEIVAWQKQRNGLQRAGDRESAKTAGQLRAEGKWLEWKELLALCRRLKDALAGFSGGKRERAIVEQEFVCVLMYVALPPGRCKEYYLLSYKDAAAANRLEERAGGELVWIVGDSKSARGRIDETSLADVDFVQAALRAWLKRGGGRDTLVSVKGCRRVFVNPRSGAPIAQSYEWTRYVESIMRTHTGQSVTPSKLRSAAVTHFWSDDQGGGGGGGSGDSSRLRTSLAAAMRHGIEMAAKTYDRRLSGQKKQRALSAVGIQARSALSM
jgi:hypothetical protein